MNGTAENNLQQGTIVSAILENQETSQLIELQPALALLQKIATTIRHVAITSMTMHNSEIQTIQVNLIRQNEFGENIYFNDLSRPYFSAYIITETQVKEFKKNGISAIEKFLSLTKSKFQLPISHILFIYCPLADLSSRKNKSTEIKLIEVFNEIVIETSSKLGIPQDRFVRLFENYPAQTNLRPFYTEQTQKDLEIAIGNALKNSIEDRLSGIEAENFAYHEKKHTSSNEWSYQKAFLHKERLAVFLNQLGLYQEALQQYEEYNNTVYEMVMRDRLNISQELSLIPTDPDNLIPLISSEEYDRLELLAHAVETKQLNFFQFYQVLMRKFLAQMIRMKYISELLDRVQHFMRFIRELFQKFQSNTENNILFNGVWTYQAIGQICSFLLKNQPTHSNQLIQNQVDYNIVLLREIQLSHLQKITKILFGISIRSFSMSSIEDEFDQLKQSLASVKLRRLKSLVQQKDLSGFIVLKNLEQKDNTLAQMCQDSTLFFNNYTRIVSDQIIALNQLGMYRKQYIYQINLLKFKILAKEIKIPQKALLLQRDEKEEFAELEHWPQLLISGLIYKILFFKNHCVVEQFRQCCLKLLMIRSLTDDQRNLVLSLIKEDEIEAFETQANNSDDEEVDQNESEEQNSKVDKSAVKIQKFINTDSDLCYLERFHMEKCQGQKYEFRLRIRKFLGFSINNTRIIVKLQDTVESDASSDSSSNIRVESKGKTLNFELSNISIGEDKVFSVSSEVEVEQKGIFKLNSVAIAIGNYLFPCVISQTVINQHHKIMLPTLGIQSLKEKQGVEVPFEHLVPVLLMIVDHDFSEPSQLQITYDKSKLRVENRCIVLTPGQERNSFEEVEHFISFNDMIDFSSIVCDEANKLAVIIFVEAKLSDDTIVSQNTPFKISLIEDDCILDSFSTQIKLKMLFDLKIKRIDAFYSIKATNLSPVPLLFFDSEYSDNLIEPQTHILEFQETASKTICPETSMIKIGFDYDEAQLEEIRKQKFIDDLEFLCDINSKKYFSMKEISKATVLNGFTLVKNPALEIVVDNKISYCLLNEQFTLDICVRLLIVETSDSFILQAVNANQQDYMMLGMTSISSREFQEGSFLWKIQILPLRSGIFELPGFEITREQIGADSIKMTTNSVLLKYYQAPTIYVTSDSSVIQANSSTFI